MSQKFGNGRWVQEGFLDNRVDGTIVGRIVFAVIGPVDVYLRGNFKADIVGQVIQFRNSRFEDEDFAGQVLGDMENPQIGRCELDLVRPPSESRSSSVYRMVLGEEESLSHRTGTGRCLDHSRIGVGGY